MKSLLVVVGFLLALASSLYFIRIRSPAAAPLTLPKMIMASGAAFVAGVGALIAVLGLACGPIAAAADSAGLRRMVSFCTQAYCEVRFSGGPYRRKQFLFL